MALPEPGWVNGDDFARGLVDDCPNCGACALRSWGCEECGYNTEPDPDYYNDLAAEEAAYYGDDA